MIAIYLISGFVLCHKTPGQPHLNDQKSKHTAYVPRFMRGIQGSSLRNEILESRGRAAGRR